MQQYRTGEKGTTIPPRSARYYKLENDWYFQVRGGASFGPYRCCDEARGAVRQLFHLEDNVVRPFGSLSTKPRRNGQTR
ncbi:MULTISPECIES: hypothetical protein [unclassified Microbulbifer]|uniref:hypothetical protein n=1 Tax=unclassified Microbulbifer TaxID=2619833 RepID=UPI0027E4F3D0|nr:MULTISPECIES: hypothetical protein [unclassified Microbulbifer]